MADASELHLSYCTLEGRASVVGIVAIVWSANEVFERGIKEYIPVGCVGDDGGERSLPAGYDGKGTLNNARGGRPMCEPAV